MCCRNDRNEHGCGKFEGHCACARRHPFLSKKGAIRHWEGVLSRLQEQAADVEEYIRELKGE